MNGCVPKAGPIAFPRMTAADLDVEEFCERLAAEAGVLLLPGTIYGHPGQHFRIGFGRRNLPEALARLERVYRRAATRGFSSGLTVASMSARRPSRNGGIESFSPRWSSSSSTVKPGEREAISNSTPLGSRK